MYHLCSSLNLATSYSLPTLFLFSAYSLPVPKSVTFLQMGTVSEEPLFRGSQISFLKQVFMPQNRSSSQNGYPLHQSHLRWSQIPSLQPLFVPKTARHSKMDTPSIKVIFAGHKADTVLWLASKVFPEIVVESEIIKISTMKGAYRG